MTTFARVQLGMLKHQRAVERQAREDRLALLLDRLEHGDLRSIAAWESACRSSQQRSLARRRTPRRRRWLRWVGFTLAAAFLAAHLALGAWALT